MPNASLSSRQALFLGTSLNMPLVDGPCSCRIASRSCRGHRRTVAWLKQALGQVNLLQRQGRGGIKGWLQLGDVGREEEPALALTSVGLVNPGSFCWGHCLSGEARGMGCPHQACLPGGAGAVCFPSCRELPGADQREPLCSRTPAAQAPLRQPRSSTAQRATAIVSPSSRSHLLQRKTEQKSMDDNHQAIPFRPSQLCPPTAGCKGETSGPRGLDSLLLRSDEDRRALWEGQQQPQCSRSAHLQEGERPFLPVFSKLPCRVANSTIIARWDHGRPLLGTSLQETCYI